MNDAPKYGDGFYVVWWHLQTFRQRREWIRYWRSRPKVRWP
jgi:hypothetical protein